MNIKSVVAALTIITASSAQCRESQFFSAEQGVAIMEEINAITVYCAQFGLNARGYLAFEAATGVSKDDLKTWDSFSNDGFNAVESKQGVTYAVGPGGKIGRLTSR